MKNGTLFTRIIARKLQGSQAAVQYILLAGFENKLVQATATYYETLNPVSMLTQQSIDAAVATLVKHSNASETYSVTKPDVQKKLDKVFEVQQYSYSY